MAEESIAPLPQQEAEQQREPAYTNSDLIFWNGLLTNGAITPQPDRSKQYAVDYEKIVAALQAKERPPFQLSTEQEWEEITSRARRTFPDVERIFRESGVIPPEFFHQIARLFTVDNVGANGDHGRDEDIDGQFLFSGKSFPEASGKRAILLVGSAEGRERLMADDLLAKGITLRPDEIKDIVTRWMASHEYGHGVHKALILRNGELTRRVNSHVGELNEEEEIITYLNSSKQINDALDTEIAPDIFNDKHIIRIQEEKSRGEYRDNLPNQEHEGEQDSYIDNDHTASTNGINSERIASGFEMIGLQAALKDYGVDEEVANYIIAQDKILKSNRLKELETFTQQIEDAGFSFSVIEAISEGISSFIDEHSPELGRNFPKFDVRTFGYEKPLTPAQLKKLVDQFSGVSSDPTSTNESS